MNENHEIAFLETLSNIGYQGPLLEEAVLRNELAKGATSQPLTQFVSWLTKELGEFYGIEDRVNAVQSDADAETFLLELSGFLREYGCPYPCLTEGPINERLTPVQNRITLLDFLMEELLAARITAVNKPHLMKKAVTAAESAETEVARYMKLMLLALGFPKPPPGIKPFQLFSKVETKVTDLLSKVHAAHMSKPLLKARLSEKQWKDVEYINAALRQEYEVRRAMMLKRLDVTIQSFRWSDRAKQREDELAAVYQPLRRILSTKCVTDIPHLLASREDLLNIEKTASGKSREKTKCDLNRVLIGRVPDRGGRAYEHDVPPPEMPSFQQRQQPQGQRQGSARGGGRGGRGGGDRGGGGWGGGGGGGNQQQGGGGGGWGAGPQYSQPQQFNNNPAAGFFGGGSGGYQPAPVGKQSFGNSQGYQDYGQQGGYQQQQGGGYQQQGGGYQGGGGGGGGGYQGGGGGGRGGGGGYHDQRGGGRGGRGRGGRGGSARGRGRGG